MVRALSYFKFAALFALFEQRLKQRAIAFSFRGIRIDRFEAGHDPLIIGAELFPEIVGLGAKGRDSFGVLFLLCLVHLILQLADVAIDLHLGRVGAD